MTVQTLTKFRKPTQKQIALTFGVDERTIRRWDKPKSITIKLGRKPKLEINSQTTLLSSIFGNKSINQQEMANHVFQRTGIKVIEH